MIHLNRTDPSLLALKRQYLESYILAEHDMPLNLKSLLSNNQVSVPDFYWVLDDPGFDALNFEADATCRT